LAGYKVEICGVNTAELPLLKAKEMLGMRLCVLHNLYFYNTMMEEIRDALDAGNFASYKEEKLYRMGQSSIKNV